ncbi:MAG: hypothetical protein E6I51_05925, partial [Chloroflexi bacterium]
MRASLITTALLAAGRVCGCTVTGDGAIGAIFARTSAAPMIVGRWGGRGRRGRDARKRWRRRHRPALRRGHSVRDRQELRKISKSLASVGQLEPRAARIALRERHVHEATVLRACVDEVALVREGGRQPPVGVEVRRRDLDGHAQDRDRADAVVLACERGRAFAEDHERAIAVLERDERSRETSVRVDVGVLRHELA